MLDDSERHLNGSGFPSVPSNGPGDICHDPDDPSNDPGVTDDVAESS